MNGSVECTDACTAFVIMLHGRRSFLFTLKLAGEEWALEFIHAVTCWQWCMLRTCTTCTCAGACTWTHAQPRMNSHMSCFPRCCFTHGFDKETILMHYPNTFVLNWSCAPRQVMFPSLSVVAAAKAVNHVLRVTSHVERSKVCARMSSKYVNFPPTGAARASPE